MKITKLKKTNSGKYKVLLDDNSSITTYDDVIIKNNLLNNKELDNKKLNSISIETRKYDIYNKLIKYITFRLRSKKEIIEYCQKLGIEDKQEFILLLSKEGLINDDNFARAFILDKINFSNLGPNKIKEELLKHDINIDTIDKYLKEVDTDIIKEKLTKYIIKKINSNRKYSNYLLKQKMLFEFSNLGYDGDIINEIIDNNLKNNDNIIKKEYKIIKDKLKKKYSGEELTYQIKSKLYQKGFSSEDINSVINEEY